MQELFSKYGNVVIIVIVWIAIFYFLIIKMIGDKRYKATLDIYVHKNYDDMKKAINQI